MGTLIEQSIKSFFQGVSRQPDSFRNPGQVDEATNVQFSVESGGFSNRVPSKLVKSLTGSTPDAALHVIDRDSTEKYVVTYYSNALRVFDPSGNEQTVNVIGAAGSYLTGLLPSDICFCSIADYTLVVNRTKVTAMAGTTSAAQQNKAVYWVTYGTSGSYKVTINGSTVTGAGSTDSSTTATNVYNALIATFTGPTWTISRDGPFVFIERADGASFTISIEDPYANQGSKVCYLKVTKSTDLPAKAPNDLVVRVGADSKSDYWVKAEQLNTGNNDVRWVETVAPGASIAFDAATMPHVLVRTGASTFEFRQNTWSQKTAGTTTTVPNPDFIGLPIKDAVFHRNRLFFLAGEYEVLSASGDYFNFWRTKSTEVLDDDPYAHVASTNEVAVLEWAVPFRKALFATAKNVQFETSGELLTPKKSSIDVSTKYSVDTLCRPVAVGDSLYIPARSGEDAVLFEYLYDDNSLTNTAIDSTKHARGYIPAPITAMCADPTNGHLFMLSSAEPNSIFVYTFFWNGQEKVQQAYGKWDMGNAVADIRFMDGHLYAIVKRSDGIDLEKFSIGNVGFEDYDFPPRLDRQVELTGSYNGTTGLTTWTLPWTATSSTKIVTSNLFSTADKKMAAPQLTVASSSTVTAVGDWSAAKVIAGFPYTALVRLSRLYMRAPDTSAVLGGRTQVRHMRLQYENTGSFKVRITPAFRDPMEYTFSGRILGSQANVISEIPIESGKFKFPIWSESESVKLEIESVSFLPMTITSAVWVGFFNELTAQDS